MSLPVFAEILPMCDGFSTAFVSIALIHVCVPDACCGSIVSDLPIHLFGPVVVATLGWLIRCLRVVALTAVFECALGLGRNRFWNLLCRRVFINVFLVCQMASLAIVHIGLLLVQFLARFGRSRGCAFP